MLKIRRPLGRLIFNIGIAIPGKTVFLIETGPWLALCVLKQMVYNRISYQLHCFKHPNIFSNEKYDGVNYNMFEGKCFLGDLYTGSALGVLVLSLFTNVLLLSLQYLQCGRILTCCWLTKPNRLFQIKYNVSKEVWTWFMLRCVLFIRLLLFNFIIQCYFTKVEAIIRLPQHHRVDIEQYQLWILSKKVTE